MFPWMNPWFDVFRAPLSGNVTQDISPMTSWFSPQLEFNFAGNKAIESQVVSEVASYGKQLGILAEAVIDLAEGRKGEALNELKDVVSQVAEVKQNHKKNIEARARRLMDELKQESPELLNQLVKEYSNKK